MNRFFISSSLTMGALCLLSACVGSKYSDKAKSSQANLSIFEKRDVIDFEAMSKQTVPSTLAMRDEALNGKNRGLDAASLIGGAVSLATQGVKLMIEMDKKKYTASYSNSLNNLYFYDQLSVKSPFDPMGIQFNGFTLLRTFKNRKGILDTAMYAIFEIDTSSAYQIINNSYFRIKLKDIYVKYAQAKVPSSRWYLPWTLYEKKNDDKLNMDFEIVFKTSYVNKNSDLFTDVTLGKFYLTLRDVPLNPKDKNYAKFYEENKDKPLDGKCFIVPRSYGYYYNDKGMLQECFSQGEYNILVNVKESGKDKFVTKILQDNSNMIIDEVGKKIIEEGKKLAK